MKTETVKGLQASTAALLKKAGAKSLQTDDITDLRTVLRFHEHRYYVQNDPLISDFEYDTLYKGLESLEAEAPDLVTSDSPTQRVAKGLTKDFPTVAHLVPMLSLDNSYNAEDLLDFDRKARELTGSAEIEYCVEPKFDGASISLLYEADHLERGATRGDGVRGDDISPTSSKSAAYRCPQSFPTTACKRWKSAARSSSTKRFLKSTTMPWPSKACNRWPIPATPRRAAFALKILWKCAAATWRPFAIT